ncbi:MAG: hypothetical protein QHH02_06105 [Syntrophomonadaceae bacterium]|nr:hypothetical protein [Syntrophomonadaceae bacterium]
MSHRKGLRPPRAAVLEKAGLQREWIDPWNLLIHDAVPCGRNQWRIESHRGAKLLRQVDWTAERVEFICAFLDHLGRGGYKLIPRFIRTADGRRWITTEKGVFYLCDYLESRPVDLSSRQQLMASFRALGRLHLIAESFSSGPMLGRAGQPGWKTAWEEAIQQLQQYHLGAAERPTAGTLDEVFRELADFLVSQMDYALRLLPETDGKGLNHREGVEIVAHGCFKEPYVRLTPGGEVYIDQFANCHYNLRTYDLGSFLYRVMAVGGWEPAVGKQCLESYEQLVDLSPYENQSLAAFLCFPHPSWSYLNAFYGKKGDYPAEQLIIGLQREASSLESKQRFLEWLLQRSG